jgi:hypothetical protein
VEIHQPTSRAEVRQAARAALEGHLRVLRERRRA